MKSQLIAIVAAVLVVGCGKTPDTIHYAAGSGNIEAVKRHLATGTDVDVKGGWMVITPLHSAASDGHKEIVELLIANGAVVNAKDEIESTPLSGAALNGHKEIAELLIAAGADVNAKNVSGRTPLDSAKRNALILRGFGFEERSEDKVKAAKKEIADLLRKHGGKTREELEAVGK